MGLLDDNNGGYNAANFTDWNYMPPAQLAFQQALDRISQARLQAASDRVTAASAPVGDPSASVYATSAAENQKIAGMDPYAYMFDLRNKHLEGDKDVSTIAATDQSTAHDKMKMAQEQQVWDDDNKLRAQIQLSLNAANGGSAPGGAGGAVATSAGAGAGAAAPAAGAAGPGMGMGGAVGGDTSTAAPGQPLAGASTIPTPPATVRPQIVNTPYGPLTRTQAAALAAAPVTKQREMLAQFLKGTDFEQELDQAGIPRGSQAAVDYARRKYNVVDQPTGGMLEKQAQEEQSTAYLLSLLDRYQQAYKAAGGYKILPGAERDNLDSLHSQILTHMTKMNDMGVLKKYDLPLEKMQIGSATEWTPWKEQSLDTQVNNMRQSLNRSLAISRQTSRPGGVATINATGQDPGTGGDVTGNGPAKKYTIVGVR